MYVVVEFKSSADGGGLAIVHKKWLTPKKRECLWPDLKNQRTYHNVLSSAASPDECWKLYELERIFCECDNLGRAREKLKKAEVTSDIQSDFEDSQSKRRRFAPRRLYESDESDGSNVSDELPRPSLKKIKLSLNKHSDQLLVRKTNPVSTSLQNTPSRPLLVSESQSATPVAQITNDSHIAGSHNYILRTLEYIKEQNNQILNILNNQVIHSGSQKFFTLNDIPVQLPISSDEDLNTLEEFLQIEENLNNFMSYLSSLGGKDVITQTNNCLRRLLTNQFACNFSFLGKRAGKKAFCDLILKRCLLGAVSRNLPQAKESDVEDAIKVWLKHSPQRYRNDCTKKQNLINLPST